MTDALRLPIESSFNPAGTDQALAALRQLQAAQAAAQPAAAGGASPAAPFQAAGQAAQQSEKDILRYASAMAQAQRATGDTAGAVETMRAAVAEMTPNTIEANRAVTQLAASEKALQRESSGVSGAMQQLGSAMQAMLAIAAASKIVQVGEALLQDGAAAQQTAARFNQLAAQAHTTGDAMLASLRQASAGTISDTNLQLAAMKANLLGVGGSAAQLAPLLAIARDRAQQMGISTAFAFDSLVTGLGRGSRLILDNIGVIVKESAVNEAYAQSVGKTVAQLSDQEKKQALINEVLRQGNASLAATGGALETNATKLERFTAMWDNLKAAIGGGLADTIGPLADDLSKLASSLQELRGSSEQTAAPMDKLNGAMVNAFTAGGSLQMIFGTLSAEAQALAGHTDEANARFAELAGQTPPVVVGVSQVAAAMHAGADAATQAAAANAQHTSGMAMEIDAAIQASAAFQAQTVELTNVANASINDTAAKNEQAATTALLTAEAQAAAQAFIALHPNITASGAASAAAAGGMSPLIARLIEATLRANEARQALALFNALAGIKASGGAMAGAKASDLSDIQTLKADAMTSSHRAQIVAANEAAAAERHLASVQGNEIPTIQHLRNEAAALAKTRGRDSADYINKMAEIAQAEKRQAADDKKAAGGKGRGDAAAKAAQATEDRIEDISRVSGNKLAGIRAQAEQKIAAIEAKYAAIRLKQQQDLADSIAEASASVKYDQTLDNFDAFQKDMSKEQQAAFQAREAAEAHYNERVAAAQEQARAEAQTGDAQLAQDKLKIRTEQAKKEQEIEERAAKANADTGGKQAAAVAAVAKASSDAAKQQADTDIAIAEAKAQERAGAEQAEKDAVAQSAKEQSDKVIAAAEESATKVRKASGSQRDAVVSDLAAQAQAVKDWADSVVSSAGRAQTAMGNVTGPPVPDTGGADTGAPDTGGGGGQGFGARRGAGGGSGSDVIATLQATVAFIDQLLPLITHQNELVKQLRTYEHTVTDTVKVLSQVVTLHKSLEQPLPPLPTGIFDQLADEITLMLVTLATRVNPNLAKQQRMFEHLLAADVAATAVFKAIVDLRKDLTAPPPPLLLASVQALAAESTQVLQILQGTIITANQRQSDDLKRYADMVGAAVATVKDIADLRRDLANAAPPLNLNWVRALATDAQSVTKILQELALPFAEQAVTDLRNYDDATSASLGIIKDVADLRRSLAEGVGPDLVLQTVERLASDAIIVDGVVRSLLLPTTEAQATEMSAYADAAGRGISILKDVADLRKSTADLAPPLAAARIRQLADEALLVVQIVRTRLIPLTEAQGTDLGTYADAAGAAVSIVKDVSDLGKDAGALRPALTAAQITELADEARRITQIALARMVPASEAEAKAARQFADTEGAAVEALKSVLDLPAKLFDDYESPSDAQIRAVVDDAYRVIQRVEVAARMYSTDGMTAAKAFSEAVGSTFAAFKDGLIFFQALDSGDFRLKPGNLRLFEEAMGMTIAVAGRLGTQAAALPPGNVAALTSTAAALTASYDSMIKLASVPFNDLRGLAGQLGAYAHQRGGGQGPITVNVYGAPGQNVHQLADAVIGRLQQRVTMRAGH